MLVLAAVDGSPESLAAARWAADEAVRRSARLRLAYAWPRPLHAAPGLPGVSEARGRALGMLADAAEWVRTNHPSLELDTALLDEHAPAGITAAADSADLVALGSSAPHSPLGSVGLAVAAHAPCPVALIRANPGTTGPPREVVVGIDAHDPAPTVLAFARKTAAVCGVQLRVVHAWMPPATWWSLSAAEQVLLVEVEESALADLLARETEPKAVPDVRRARAADALVDASRSAGLLVLGRTGHHLGPVTRTVVHRVRCPVAVVPRG
ncbi:universal stress protein [Kitasatospora sp. NPDC018058]|uniref:universal stress protein n=1 Tax=Kitasatospora sp. NPDC018058 TaxID=3364025 RepID=UPI0037BF7224